MYVNNLLYQCFVGIGIKLFCGMGAPIRTMGYNFPNLLRNLIKFVVVGCSRVEEPLIGFLDVAFLHSQASFSTVFLNNGGRGKGLRGITCLKIVVGVIKGLLSVKLWLE